MALSTNKQPNRKRARMDRSRPPDGVGAGSDSPVIDGSSRLAPVRVNK